MHAVNTTNYYGKISISANAIAVVAGFCALECYGVVDLVSHSIKDSVKYLIKKQPYAKGVKITNITTESLLIYIAFSNTAFHFLPWAKA